MNEQAFLEKREPDWKRLQWLCDKADASIRSLNGDELREFVRLYRRTTTDLAFVQTQSSNAGLADFLNSLVGRAYSLLYRQPRSPFVETVLGMLTQAADTIRRRRVFVFLAITTFAVSGLFSYFVLDWVPATRDVMISPQMEPLVKQWQSGEFDERTGDESFAMSGFYASNNPRVAIIAGAVGAGTFGLLSVYLNWQNGMQIGVLAHETNEKGTMGNFLSSITPHGVPELSGIFIAAACGMLLGWALINPGRLSRGESLRAVGKDAVTLLATSVVMMFIAAPIEGFFSFNPNVPNGLKLVVAAVELVAWLAFWSFFGRTKEALPQK